MAKIICNGRIYIKKGIFCEALVIESGRIIRTGSTSELLEETRGAEKINAEGALVIPAFCDSHMHLSWAGRRARGIEAAGSASIEEVINRGKESIARNKPPPDSYVLGDGVNPDLFIRGEKRDLTREDADKISTEHAVVLSRHCGHTIYCNSLALRLAGFSESAPEIEGGTVEKDKNGRPTGVLRENAAVQLRRNIPQPSGNELKSMMITAMKKAQSFGISSIGSYDSNGPDFEDILGVYRDIYDESRAEGVPQLRVTMQCGISNREDILDAHIKRGIYLKPLWEDPEWGSFLKMGSIKLFADGTLGGRTAWMRQPYRDKKETSGFPVLDQGTLDHFVGKISRAGMQALIHAIGDAGIDSAITAFERAAISEKSPGSNPCRHGIIHCQITTADLLERMARNKILAIVQPVFLADDIHILESRIGPQLASTSYAWGSMHKASIPVSYSTDAPVSSMDPLLNLQWAVNRGGGSSEDKMIPGMSGEKVDIYSAFEAYTASAAFSAFAEGSLGRIAPGCLADLVFLDRDIFSVEGEGISRARVLRTMIAGETVYSV